MKLRVWDTRISLQDVAGTPGAPPKQKLQDGNLNVLGGTKPTGSVRPGRPKTSQAIERISIHDIMSIRIAPLLIQIDQCSYKLPNLWASLGKPGSKCWSKPRIPTDSPGGITTPGLPLGEADRAIPAEHAEVPGSLAQEVHLWPNAAKWVDSYWCSLWFMTHRIHRIHGAAIYGNMDPINIPPMLVYVPYMDPMGDGIMILIYWHHVVQIFGPMSWRILLAHLQNWLASASHYPDLLGSIGFPC